MKLIEEIKEEIKELVQKYFYDEIVRAISEGKRRILIDFSEIERINLKIAEHILRVPEIVIPIFEKAVNELRPPTPLEIEEGRIKRINVRFRNLPESCFVEIRNLRSEHIGKFIVVEGIVKVASDVRPIARAVRYRCENCGWVSDWIPVELLQKPRKVSCPECKKSTYVRIFRKALIDAQRLIIEELPERAQGQPKTVNVILLDDLVDPDLQKYTTPGKAVRVSGILKEFPVKGREMYEFVIIANWIEPLKEEVEEIELTEKEIEEIKKLSKDPNLEEKIVKSIAPSIAGHEMIKYAIALQLFGGVKKERPDKTKVRGNIHILLIGDPGTGKCFSPETKILTKKGWIEIRKLYERLNSKERKRNDLFFKHCEIPIYSLDEDLRLRTFDAIAVSRRKYSGKMIEIYVGKKRICVTEEHPIYVLTEGGILLKRAGDLRVGDILITFGRSIIDGKKRPFCLESIEKIREKKVKDYWVYDIQVKDVSSLFANGIFVHNSQILKSVAEIAPKGMYVSGKGVTGVGITATVTRDDLLGGWKLEVGPLILMSGGILCIDELDKIKKDDLIALHEALEQQTISISKANIHATLIAETSILAAANPKFGRFDPYRPIPEQIDLPPTIINRFDLIFPLKDIPEIEKDKRIAEHILMAHIEGEKIKPEIPIDLLKKYIAYARKHVHPKLTKEAAEEIKKFFLELRAKVANIEEGIKPIPISARQLEALVRLAEARARMFLRKEVTREDALKAIELMKYYLREVGMEPETGVIDIDRIMTGIPARKRDKISRIIKIVENLSKEFGGSAPIEEVLAEAEKQGIDPGEARKIIEELKRKGDIFEPSPGKVAVV